MTGESAGIECGGHDGERGARYVGDGITLQIGGADECAVLNRIATFGDGHGHDSGGWVDEAGQERGRLHMCGIEIENRSNNRDGGLRAVSLHHAVEPILSTEDGG